MIEICKTRINSLEGNLPSELKNKELMLAVDLASNAVSAARIGFGDSPAEGDSVLPRVVGPTTKLNAWGRDIIRRDLPKETYYRTQEWTHEEWRGRGETETVTTMVDVPYYKYPRDHEAASGIELTITSKNRSLLITILTSIRYGSANDEQLKTAINLFLEIFGSVTVYDKSLEPIITQAQLRRLNWQVLPPGQKITSAELETALNDVLSKSKRVRPVELLRQNKLIKFSPDVMAVGTAGFKGYVIYVFNNRRVAVLESIRYGNATYVINSADWEQLSKLTKQQLIVLQRVDKRLIHTLSWFTKINELMGVAKAKRTKAGAHG